MRFTAPWVRLSGTVNVAMATALVAMPLVVAAGFLGDRRSPVLRPPVAPPELRGTFEGG